MRVKGFLKAFFTACTWRSFSLFKLHPSTWSVIERFSSGKRIWSTSDKKKKFYHYQIKKTVSTKFDVTYFTPLQANSINYWCQPYLFH